MFDHSSTALPRGTEGSNPSPSSVESGANLIFGDESTWLKGGCPRWFCTSSSGGSIAQTRTRWPGCVPGSIASLNGADFIAPQGALKLWAAGWPGAPQPAARLAAPHASTAALAEAFRPTRPTSLKYKLLTYDGLKVGLFLACYAMYLNSSAFYL